MTRSLRTAIRGPVTRDTSATTTAPTAGAASGPPVASGAPAASRAPAASGASGAAPVGAPRRVDSGRAGGVAALVQAATFVFGFVIYGTVVAGGDYANPAIAPSVHVDFLVDHQLVLHVWYAVIYLVFGGALVVVAPALHDRVRAQAPVLGRSATIFGLIWATLMFAVGMSAIVGGRMVAELSVDAPAQAAALWSTTDLLMEGMGGGIELVGGLWMALISVAALRAGALTRALNVVGVVGGAAGIASTALVATEVVTSVFGLASIVWFTWLGVHMVRTPSSSPRAA